MRAGPALPSPTAIDWIAELLDCAGADDVRALATTGRCDGCGRDVVLFEFRTPLLTSYGATNRWQTAAPHAHSRDCFLAVTRRVNDLPDLDLWSR